MGARCKKIIDTLRDGDGVRSLWHDALCDRDEHLKISRADDRKRARRRRDFLRRKQRERSAAERENGPARETAFQKRSPIQSARSIRDRDRRNHGDLDSMTHAYSRLLAHKTALYMSCWPHV